MNLRINPSTLEAAVAAGLLQPGQASALWAWLQARQSDRPQFKPSHILLYLGAMIAIGALSVFVNMAWELLGGAGLAAIGLCAGIGAAVLAEWLLAQRQLRLPAGIFAALAVTLVPLTVYGLQQWAGAWPASGAEHLGYRDYHTRIDWRWLTLELATLAAATAALWRWRLPFTVMPLAVTLWYMSMDLVPLLLGDGSLSFWSPQGRLISAAFGLAMLLLALWVELRQGERDDFAFWLHLFGMLAFWGALMSAFSDSELARLAVAGVNLLLIGIGAALSRRVYALFGGLGLAGYLGHLSYTVFQDSLLFPVTLAALGLALVACGVLWQRHEAAIGTRLRAALPARVRATIERRSGL